GAAGGLREQATGAEQHRKQRPHLSEVLPEPLPPDEATIVVLQLHGLSNQAAERAAAGIERTRRRDERRHARVLEHVARGEEQQEKEADEEPGAGFEPRFSPEHVSPPRTRFRGRFPSASPARRRPRPDSARALHR